ncbi:hypothetical protein NECAME_09964 [Necator americanus]|uniref:Uncharacterized protein n=1 Tax=Necator americanus TaxID=51031 RepID=W2TBC2_NECAM|nr:hypothetical protein NECAME_09964 [Necator americanus]ETN79158.1 hypothetical protein NECAME_09964 [Necator americanus]
MPQACQIKDGIKNARKKFWFWDPFLAKRRMPSLMRSSRSSSRVHRTEKESDLNQFERLGFWFLSEIIGVSSLLSFSSELLEGCARVLFYTWTYLKFAPGNSYKHQYPSLLAHLV